MGHRKLKTENRIRKTSCAVLCALYLLLSGISADAGLRQALTYYKQHDYIKALEALKGENGEQADYISARCASELVQLYRELNSNNIKYGIEYLEELKKGEGKKKSLNLPRFLKEYDSLVGNKRGNCVKAQLDEKCGADIDEAVKVEVMDKNKTLYFYEPCTYFYVINRYEEITTRHIARLVEGNGKFSAAAMYYRLTLECVEGQGAIDYCREVIDKEGMSKSYFDRAGVYLLVLEAQAKREAVSLKGLETPALRALALKLASEKGINGKGLEEAAVRLEKEMAENKERETLALLGEYYLNTAQEEKALAVFEEARDKSNKNSIAHNDPLFMLKLARAYYMINRYDECLQILLSMSELFPGLRPLQNSVQGVYAARQKSGGEVRINQ